MNRRGHLSTKIANVKLRPASSATAASRQKREASPLNAMDAEILERALAAGEDEDVSSAAIRSDRKPWAQVVITFTGVENKPRLAEMARQLGATIESALTVSVTHVVASGFGSAKYLYAVEHRLPVMKPSWIEGTHRRWLAAEEVDVLQSMAGHRLLPFTGLTICMSGVEPLERRKEVISFINTNGGVYAKDLDHSATHLVTVQPTNIRAPSAKVKWAINQLQQSDQQRRAGKRVETEDIKVVYEDWIWDCLGFEGRWKEDWYDARKVRRASRTKYEEVMSGEAKEKMEKAMIIGPAIEEEPAVLKKRKRDAMENLVGDIISTSGVSARSGLGAVDVKPDQMELDDCTATGADASAARPGLRVDSDGAGSTTVDRKPSILHATRTTSFAHINSAAGPSRLSGAIGGESTAPGGIIPVTEAVDIKPTSSELMLAKQEEDGEGEEGGEQREMITPPIFEGRKFTPIMTDRTDVLEAALVAHAGTVVRREEWEGGKETDYIIVRLSSNLRPELDHIPEVDRPQIVTECWIEGCCYEQRLIPLDEHIAFRPLSGTFPIPGADKMSVHLSGFTTENAVYLKRLLKAIGLKVSEKLSRQTTHLVCGSPTGQKYKKALEWRVSVVRNTWLLDMAKSARMESEEVHRHHITAAATVTAPVDGTGTTRTTSHVSSTTDGGSTDMLARTGTEVDGLKPIVESEDVIMKSDPASVSKRTDQLASRSTSMVSADLQALPPSSPSTSALRRLKLTPTHIDEMGASAADRQMPFVAKVSSLPLSPPTHETERLLNKADVLPAASRRNHSEPAQLSLGGKAKIQAESIESKLSRTSSAPVPPSSSANKDGKDMRSTSVTSMNGNLGRPEMSEMLKLLVQSDPAVGSTPTSGTNGTPGSTRSVRPMRRPRTSGPGGTSASSTTGISRLRTSMAYPSSTADGESDIGDTTADTTLHFTPSPPRLDGLGGPGGPVLGYGYADESVRVDYADPAAEKERRKIMEALRRNAADIARAERAGAAIAGGGAGEGMTSAKKRRM